MANPPDELALLEAAVDRFSRAPLPEGGPYLASFLHRVQRASDRISVKFSQGAAAFAETDEYDQQGSLSPLHWIRVNCNLTSGAAGDRLAVGEQLQSIPQSHQSMVEGEIGFAHLAHIARTSAAIEQTTNKPFDEAPLRDKARDLTVGRFIDFCHHMRHTADPEGYAAEQAQAVESRSLTMKTGEGGMVWLRGVFDPEGGAVLRTAFEPLAKRNGKEDDRNRDRRRPVDPRRVARRGGRRPPPQGRTSLETLLQRAGPPAADLEFSRPISARAV